MDLLEEYANRADELAQDVVNAWALNVRAGNANLFTPEFTSVFDRACEYRTARQVADNYREFEHPSERAEADETAKRNAFVKAYKSYREKQEPTS